MLGRGSWTPCSYDTVNQAKKEKRKKKKVYYDPRVKRQQEEIVLCKYGITALKTYSGVDATQTP